LYVLLVRLRLTATEAFLSVLVAVFGTRLLNIMQIHQEDIHHLLFLAGATYWLLRWLDDKRGFFLGLAAACFGFNLLTRLTTGIDVIVITAAIAVLLMLEKKASWRDEIQSRVRQMFFVFVPVLLFFLLADRAFHF
jgi:5'(3')-deoxyribonucleotidase